MGAAIALIWTLAVPWSLDGNGGGLVYVLLTVLCSIASLLPVHLQRLMVRPDGQPAQWPTMGLRLAMNVPLAIVALTAVIRDIVHALGGPGPGGLGPGVVGGIFGLVLAAVPRQQELLGRADAHTIASRWRRGAGWASGLGLASVLITTIASFFPFGGLGGGGGLVLLILVLLALVLFFVMVLAVPVLRVGADHVAWQPTALWLGSVFVLLVLIMGTGAGGAGQIDSAADPLYGVWLLILGAALCATPLVGGVDGSPQTAQFWGIVVANAFRVILVGSAAIAAVGLLAVVGSVQDGSVDGQVLWMLVAAVICLIAAAVGSSRLRADVIAGRRVAFGCLGVMALVTVVTLAVDGFASVTEGTAGGPVGVPLMIGSYLVIIFGLTGPAPIRAAVAAHQAATGPAPLVRGPQPAAPSDVRTATAAQPPAPTAPRTSGWNPPTPPLFGAVEPATDGMTLRIGPPPSNGAMGNAPVEPPDAPSEVLHDAVAPPSSPLPAAFGRFATDPVAPSPAWPTPAAAALRDESHAVPTLVTSHAPDDARDTDDVERTVVRSMRSAGSQAAPNTNAAATTLDQQRAAAADPATPLQTLMVIAQSRPDLRSAIAANPSTYPDLLTWLGRLGDPSVDAALARRDGDRQ